MYGTFIRIKLSFEDCSKRFVRVHKTLSSRFKFKFNSKRTRGFLFFLQLIFYISNLHGREVIRRLSTGLIKPPSSITGRPTDVTETDVLAIQFLFCTIKTSCRTRPIAKDGTYCRPIVVRSAQNRNVQYKTTQLKNGPLTYTGHTVHA